jgi:acetyl-CoA carboxylase carboxyltransferase component
MLSLFAGSGHLFREQVVMSGVVPQVAAMVGPGAAGTAYIPGLADYVPMVKNIGSLALGGPALVKAVTGQEISEQELGGSKIHAEVSGVGDGEFENDAACLAATKKYLSYFGSSCDEPPPDVPCTDSIERRDESLLDLVPDSNRKPYDMYKLIRSIVDHGDFLDIKPRFARSIITCLARIGANPTTWAASSTWTAPTRRRGSSRSATRSTFRSCSSKTSRASWSARRSSTLGSFATAPRCCTS